MLSSVGSGERACRLYRTAHAHRCGRRTLKGGINPVLFKVACERQRASLMLATAQHQNPTAWKTSGSGVLYGVDNSISSLIAEEVGHSNIADGCRFFEITVVGPEKTVLAGNQ